MHEHKYHRAGGGIDEPDESRRNRTGGVLLVVRSWGSPTGEPRSGKVGRHADITAQRNTKLHSSALLESRLMNRGPKITQVFPLVMLKIDHQGSSPGPYLQGTERCISVSINNQLA